MTAIQSTLAVLRFVLELILVAVYGWFGLAFGTVWGGQLPALILGLGLPALVMLIWGMFVAPRAPRRSAEPMRFALELALFFSGMAMLAAASAWAWGMALFLVFVIDRLLLDRLGKPAWAEPRAVRR